MGCSHLAFFSFCRSREVTVPSKTSYDPRVHLSLSDIKCDNPSNPSTVSIFIKRLKTDQPCNGVKVYIGKTKDDLCPVTALLTYLKMHGKHQGPLLQWSTCVPLTRERFVQEVKSALVLVGVDASKYSGLLVSELGQRPRQLQQG